MGNDDLTNALMRGQGIQGFMGGGMATHTMPDGTVMPGANHGEYQAMGMRHGGTAHRGAETGAVINDAELRRQLEQMMGSETGAVINDAQMQQMMQMGAETGAVPPPENLDPAQELQQAIQQLEIQKTQTSDPDEIKSLDRLIEVAIVGANAPLREMALEMQAQGRGEDTALAHLRPGEVILPPEAFEDLQFENTVARKLEELGIDPEEAIAGVGIASLNPMTGLEEFGFFKKIGKAIKKVAKKIAPIAGPLANFIPGVGPLLAAGIGAATNVVGGKGLTGAISGAIGGYGAGRMLGGIGSLGTVGGNVVGSGNFQNLGFLDKLRAVGSGAKAGIGSLFGGGTRPAGGLNSGYPDLSGLNSGYPDLSGLNSGGYPDLSGLNSGGYPDLSGLNQTPGFFGGLISGGGADGRGNYGVLGDIGGGLAGGLLGGGGGGGLGSLGSLAAAGVPAYLLGKMAYDEAKKDKGVALTPLTTMGPTGRYNIEAEIARRMGTQTPNPVEFGLLPQGTFPQLSGGQPMAAAGGGAVYPMAYAEGGNVAIEDFQRMNGDINGAGTETSDDVPAMLSDGEFVMTGAAVRGAGGFDMKNKGGILTLTPSGTPDRERGTNVMYEMMDLFGSYANV